MALFRKFEPRKYIHKIIALMNAGEYLEAMETCEWILQKVPRHEEAARLMGQICEKLGNFRKAVNHYKIAVDGSPHYANLRAYGDVCLRLGEYNEAISAFERALERSQDSVDTMSALADIYEEKGYWPKAVGMRKAISDRDPEDCDALFNLVLCTFKAKLMDEAVILCTRLLKIDPLHSRGLRMLADCMLSRHQQQRALELYERSLQSQPDDWEGHFQLANLYYDMHHREQALSSFQSCLRYNNAHIDAHRRLINLYLEAEQWLEAQIALKHLLTTNGESTELLDELGDVSYKQKDYDEAITTWQQIRLQGNSTTQIDAKYVEASIHSGRAHEVHELAASLLSNDVFNHHFRFLHVLCLLAMDERDKALACVQEVAVSSKQHAEFFHLRNKLLSEAPAPVKTETGS